MRPGPGASQPADWIDAHPAVDLLAGKWTLPILAALDPNPLRHGELARALGPGIAPKVFGENLARLQHDGLITKQSDDDGHTHRYTLTDLGRSLYQPVAHLSLNTPNNYSPCGAADRKVPPDLR
jgi:DNA-binding HxlR family transcriptional regulator